MKTAPNGWTKEGLGVWLLAVRDSDFDGRAVDLPTAKSIAGGKSKAQVTGLSSAEVKDVVIKVEAAVEIIKNLDLKPDFRVEKEATDTVNDKALHNLATLEKVLTQVALNGGEIDKVSCALFEWMMSKEIPKILLEIPSVVTVLEYHGLYKVTPPPPPEPVKFDPFDL